MPTTKALEGEEKQAPTDTHNYKTHIDWKDYLPQNFQKEFINDYYCQLIEAVAKHQKNHEQLRMITELDLSNLNLGMLYINKSLQLLKKLCFYYNLTSLNMSNNFFSLLTDASLRSLFEQLQSNTLTHLDLSGNKLGRLSVKRPTSFFHLKNIKHLNISNNGLHKLGLRFAFIIRAIGKNTVNSIEISFSDVLEPDDEQYDALILALKSRKIPTLILSDNEQGYKIKYSLLQQRIPTLKTAVDYLELHIHKDHLQQTELKELATLLKTPKIDKARTLQLSFREFIKQWQIDSNQITEQDSKRKEEHAKIAKQLKYLSIKSVILYNIDELYSEKPWLLFKEIDGLTNSVKAWEFHFIKNTILKFEFFAGFITLLKDRKVTSVDMTPFNTDDGSENIADILEHGNSQLNCKLSPHPKQIKGNNMVTLGASQFDDKPRSKSDASMIRPRTRGIFRKEPRRRTESSPVILDNSASHRLEM